jgi:hypothetical protein
MRFYSILLMLCLLSFSAHAQEKAKPDAKDSVTVAAEETAEKKPPVDWIAVESTGTLASATEGAFEKTLWKGQKRSEIESVLQKLPSRFGLHSVLNLQRRLLLSATDAKLIENDIGPLRGNDLLIQRINKLMDMGLYDDAWDLYTQKAEEPYDVSIAQMGMLLLLMRNDMATACLEEKVFSTRYPKDKFFDVLDLACSETLGTDGGKKPQFPQNPTLQAVYNNTSFSVSAATPDALAKMGDLERALVLANGKIRYDGLTAAVLKNTPSTLVALYVMDRNLPDTAKNLIKAEMQRRGLSWHTAALARDPLFKRAKDLSKDPEDQWPILEEALVAHSYPGELVPYADMLAGGKPAQLSTENLKKVLGALLAAQKQLPDYWLKTAQRAAPENPVIYIYLQSFKSLTPSPDATVNPQDFLAALQKLKPADMEQILAIIETLDKDAAFLNNPLTIYEKQASLTLEGNYVMPSQGLNMLLETAPGKKQIGITVMGVTNALAADPDRLYPGTVRQALESMLNVGLLEDAKLIGAETVASVLNKY